MTKYASKELIDRAVGLNGMTISNEIDHDEWKDARDDLIKDLAKATPLPYLVPRDEIDAICDLARRAPRPEPLPTDAENEAKIHAWREGAKEYPDRSRRGDCYIVTSSEIDKICDIARRAPNPEPRASSTLLETARKAVEGWELRGGIAVEMNRLRDAVKAEEARGPSEVELLRKENAELDSKYHGFERTLRAIQDCHPTPARFREDDQLEPPWEVVARIWRSLNDSEKSCEQLRKERDEAIARAEEADQHVCDVCFRDVNGDPSGWCQNRQEGRYVCACVAETEPYQEAIARAEEAEAERDKAIDRSNANFAKLQLLREWVEDYDDGSGDGLVDRANLVDEIDRLLDNPAANPPSVDSEGSADAVDDDPLREWLESYDPTKQDQAALAELCRRAMGER